MIDFEEIVKTIHQARHPEEYERMRSSCIIHKTIDWSKNPPTSVQRIKEEEKNKAEESEEENQITEETSEVDKNAAAEKKVSNEEDETEESMNMKHARSYRRGYEQPRARHRTHRDSAEQLKWDILTTNTRSLRIDTLKRQAEMLKDKGYGLTYDPRIHYIHRSYDNIWNNEDWRRSNNRDSTCSDPNYMRGARSHSIQLDKVEPRHELKRSHSIPASY